MEVGDEALDTREVEGEDHREGPGTGEEPNLLQDWPEAVRKDPDYARILKAVQDQDRRFPSDLRLKVSIAECGVSPSGKLTYRGRVWVPSAMNLRVRVLQATHDSTTHVHPGRESMYAIVARQFFWPGIARDIRTFVAACDGCGSNKVWRSKRQGFLKPLPIPSRV